MIGIDVVSISRLTAAIEREPKMLDRLFTQPERRYCTKKPEPMASLAGILAAKEATMKALGLSGLPAWARRIEISHSEDGSPVALTGAGHVRLSISHDGGVAMAVAMQVPAPVTR